MLLDKIKIKKLKIEKLQKYKKYTFPIIAIVSTVPFVSAFGLITTSVYKTLSLGISMSLVAIGNSIDIGLKNKIKTENKVLDTLVEEYEIKISEKKNKKNQKIENEINNKFQNSINNKNNKVDLKNFLSQLKKNNIKKKTNLRNNPKIK